MPRILNDEGKRVLVVVSEMLKIRDARMTCEEKKIPNGEWHARNSTWYCCTWTQKKSGWAIIYVYSWTAVSAVVFKTIQIHSHLI